MVRAHVGGKRECRKVKITNQEFPEGFKDPSYPPINIIAAELTDEMFKDPYDDPAYVLAELLASTQ